MRCTKGQQKASLCTRVISNILNQRPTAGKHKPAIHSPATLFWRQQKQGRSVTIKDRRPHLSCQASWPEWMRSWALAAMSSVMSMVQPGCMQAPRNCTTCTFLQSFRMAICVRQAGLQHSSRSIISGLGPQDCTCAHACKSSGLQSVRKNAEEASVSSHCSPIERASGAPPEAHHFDLPASSAWHGMEAGFCLGCDDVLW